jgi:tetratricopeptide (TPR) repeat protein
MFASRGEYELAIADFTDALNLDPDMASAWMLRGRALYASVSYVTSVGGNFSSVGTTRITGSVVSEEKKAVYDRAIADYNQALRLDPNYATAYSNRGNAYYAKKDYDRAIADYNQALRLDPNHEVAYTNRGTAYYAKGDYDRAMADYNQALRLDPNNAWAYGGRGLAYNQKGQKALAIQDLEKAVQLDPNLQWAKDELRKIRGY